MSYVLLVDDSSEFLEVFSHTLKRNNINTVIAGDEDAMNRELQNKKPNLIIIDIMLSNSDGRELCKALKESEEYKDIPVFLLSSSLVKLQDYKSYAADDIVSKPFQIGEVLKKINVYMS